MGGKDTIVVDKEADLELAAQSIVKSAFGFQWSKMFCMFTCCYR